MIHVLYEMDGYGGLFSPSETHSETFETMELALAWLKEKAKKGFPYFIGPGQFRVFEGVDRTAEVTKTLYARD